MLDIKKLDNLRLEIDKIDDNILNLLIERAKISAEVGNIKKGLQKEIYDRERESTIFENLLSKCREQNIDFEYVRNIWNIILNKSHEIQIHGK